MDDIFDNQHTCPVCNAKFFKDEDIVVCPECGTPHHKACWQSLGHCANAANHGVFAADNAADTDDNRNNVHDAASEKTCPSCRKIIDKNHLFCPWCGYDFIAGESQQTKNPFGGANPFGSSPFGGQQQSENGEAGGFPFGGGFTSYTPPTFDRLGGVDPNEDIDGVSAEKMAGFVGNNSRRYIPFFTQKTTDNKEKKTGWNWAAFLIPQYWSVFRKNYIGSIFAFIMTLIANVCLIPFTNKLYELMEQQGGEGTYYGFMGYFDLAAKNFSEFSKMSIILVAVAVALLIGTRIIYGLFGDWFYKKHCVNIVKGSTEKISDLGEETFNRKFGNVSILAVLIAYFAFETITTLITLFI